MVLKRSLLKEKVNSNGFNMAGDFAERLEDEVNVLISKACGRAAANSRKTVSGRDL